MIIHCVTRVTKTGADVARSDEVWSNVSTQAAIDACLHDVSQQATDEYLSDLRAWLLSGDDITSVEIPNGFNHVDVWSVEHM